MHRSYLLPSHILSILEGESQNPLRCRAGNEFDALHDAVNDNVLDARILALGVFTDKNGVNVVVGGFVAGNGFARTDIGKEVKGTTEGEVERDMAFADGSLREISQECLLMQS